jgi:DNA-binding CsgD family transcriptional regulator
MSFCSPTIDHDSPSVVAANPGVVLEDFLVRLDEKLRQRNERVMERLQAWAELLDVAGWCVALDLTGEGLWISKNAEHDLKANGEIPPAWPDLMDAIPAESIHHEGEGTLIWSGSPVVSAMPEPVVALTRRESEVMSWLREGKTGPEIAIILGCASRTVEKHLANLYRKLGVRNRAAVILKVSNPID